MRPRREKIQAEVSWSFCGRGLASSYQCRIGLRINDHAKTQRAKQIPVSKKQRGLAFLAAELLLNQSAVTSEGVVAHLGTHVTRHLVHNHHPEAD